jgi:hypothetical protein
MYFGFGSAGRDGRADAHKTMCPPRRAHSAIESMRTGARKWLRYGASAEDRELLGRGAEGTPSYLFRTILCF